MAVGRTRVALPAAMLAACTLTGAPPTGEPRRSAAGEAPSQAASPAANPARTATIDDIDVGVRRVTIGGPWIVTFRLVDFVGGGTHYRPYIEIGGVETWDWKVMPACTDGPCDVRYETKSALLPGAYLSSLAWDAELSSYRSQGVTALPQAYCRDHAGRIPDSYVVEQSVFIAPSQIGTDAQGGVAARLVGLRIDRGRPAEGMSAACASFTETWEIAGSRPQGWMP